MNFIKSEKSKFWKVSYWTSIVTLLLVSNVFLVSTSANSAPSSGAALTDVWLHNGDGATATGSFNTGNSTCPWPPGTQTGFSAWHFQISAQGSWQGWDGNIGSSASGLSFKFNSNTGRQVISGGGYLTSKASLYIYTPISQNYILTGGIDGDINTSYATIDGTQFQLSHTCAGVPVVPTATVTTQVSSSSVLTGTPVTDSATVILSDGSAGGKVSFYVCYDANTAPSSCSNSAPATKVGADKTVTASGVAVTSDPYTPTQAGHYLFYAYYSGHASASNVGDSGGASERFVATSPAVPTATITTTASSSLVNTGNQVSDSATVTLSDGSAGGVVSFYVCYQSDNYPGSCSTSGEKVGADKPVTTSGVAVTSDPYVPTRDGFYLFFAYYSGYGSVVGVGDDGAASERFRAVTPVTYTPTSPSPTPTPTATPTPTPTATPTPTPTPTQVPTPVPAPTPEVTPFYTPAPTPDALILKNTYFTPCGKPINLKIKDLIGNADPANFKITSIPAKGTLVKISPTEYVFTPADSSCNTGKPEGFSYSYLDSKGAVVLARKEFVVLKQGDVPKWMQGGGTYTQNERTGSNSTDPLVLVLFNVMLIAIATRVFKTLKGDNNA